MTQEKHNGIIIEKKRTENNKHNQDRTSYVLLGRIFFFFLVVPACINQMYHIHIKYDIVFKRESTNRDMLYNIIRHMRSTSQSVPSLSVQIQWC